MEATGLTENEIRQAINVLPKEFRQAHRLVQFLAENPKTDAAIVRSICEVGNISDVAKKANVFLEPVSLMISCASPPEPQSLNWSMYGNDYANTRYSRLDQVNAENVANLKVVWEFDLNNAAVITDLTLELNYDNAYVAYLNGVKVAEDSAPAALGWFSQAASSGRSDRDVVEGPIELSLSVHRGVLRDGKNVLTEDCQFQITLKRTQHVTI